MKTLALVAALAVVAAPAFAEAKTVEKKTEVSTTSAVEVPAQAAKPEVKTDKASEAKTEAHGSDKGAKGSH